MPVANRYSLKEVLPACMEYYEKTGRRLTFEYSLVAGVNDSRREAERLARLLKHTRGHVNLIPVNPIRERNFKQSDREAVEAFRKEKRWLHDYAFFMSLKRHFGMSPTKFRSG